MKRITKPGSPVIIDAGPGDWQVLQQDAKGVATIALSGRWSTIMKRKKPEVMVRIAPEGNFRAISKEFDWKKAKLKVDRSAKGKNAGKIGEWEIRLKSIPCGGPYRIETNVGSSEDSPEWRRCGDSIHFLCVGDLWLIAGQSNAEGYAREPIDDPSEIGVHQLTSAGCWTIAAHETRHNPWIAFAKKLKRELGYPIGIIPTAVGGSAMSEWDPGQRGLLYGNMKKMLGFAENRIKGCLWYQGESDTGEKDYSKYKTRFGRFVKGLRQLVRAPGLPVITVQLNRVLGSRDDTLGWEAIREIQRQLAHEISNVFVISIFEAGLSDGIHISSTGNILLAERSASTALGGVYGFPIAYKQPECVSARMSGRRKVDLRFDNVKSRLDYEYATDNSFPFSIRDDDGEVGVSGYRILRGNIFRIELERQLNGRAKVIGAPGCCPPQIMPRDIDGYRCILAFTRKID